MAKKSNREYLRMPKINPAERHFVLVLIASILIPLVRTLFKLVPSGQEKLPKKAPLFWFQTT